MAGGSGTRLWPMSTASQPKQLIPFINGKSLLQIAFERLEGLVEAGNRYICAGNLHRNIILERLNGFGPGQFIGEPTGRDTLNALAYSAAVLFKKDPDAVMAVFTADHIIEPVDKFLEIVERGYKIVEANEDCLVTFGVSPDYAATGFGYLELGDDFQHGSKLLKRFKEKPDKPTAENYFKTGAERYLWNSGMFVWKAETLLKCVEKYEPENYRMIMEIAENIGKDGFEDKLEEIYPKLRKISIDFAVMEPASADDEFRVAAVPMPLSWIDIGSWTAFSGICESDGKENSYEAKNHMLLEGSGNFIASDDDDHLVAGIGIEDLIVIHTKKATLICPKDRDQDIKTLYNAVREEYGDDFI